MILKLQTGGNMSPEYIDSIVAGVTMPQTSAEARAAALKAGKSSYYWNGQTIELGSPGAVEPEVNSKFKYDYPTATPPIVQEVFGKNQGENLKYSNLDAIAAGEVMPQTRNEAFAAARRAGKKQFYWAGKSYHTKTADDVEREKRAATPGIASVESMDLVVSPSAKPMLLLNRPTTEYEGILRGPEVRKQNRVKSRSARQDNRAIRKEGRQENREERQDRRQERRAIRKAYRNGTNGLIIS